MNEQKRLGDMLIEHEVITHDDLLRALEVSRDTGERLGSVLLRLRLVNAGMLVKFLGEQQSCEGINLYEVPPSPEALNLVPPELAIRLGCIPVWIEGDTLAVAMMDPRDEAIVAALAEHTGKKIKRLVALQSTIFAAIKTHYGSASTPLDLRELREVLTSMRELVHRIEKLLGE
jgi:Type II secretion system (T2SS), protein E, N-terminal domain